MAGEPPGLKIATTQGETLVRTPSLALLTPLLGAEGPPALGPPRPRWTGRSLAATLQLPGRATATYRVRVEPLGDALLLQAEYVAQRAHALYGWRLFPEETRFNLYELINFRHRAGMRDVYIKLPLAAGAGHTPGGDTYWDQTGTYSDDWNFAPHPSVLLFRKNLIHLLIGALDLPAGFGLRCAIRGQRVVRFWHDFGAGIYRVRAGERVVSPRYLLLVREFTGGAETLRDDWLWEMAGEYVEALRRQGLIPAFRRQPKFAWHLQPHYCTWGDQVFLARQSQGPPEAAGAVIRQQQQQDFALAHHIASPEAMLNEALVRRAATVIQREKLPIKIFIIDAGWQRGLGEWVVNEGRFPDLRGLIDWLHAQGFKVALWWAAVHLDMNRRHWPAARYLADGGRTLMTHGIPLIDYSYPLTRKEYLEPTLRRMISAEPGCYNADMIKLDFMADKVQRHIPVHDRNWCGEERYFYELFRYIAVTCRGYKPEFCLFTMCPHPYLAQWQELVLTSELWTSDPWAHWEKMRYIRTFCPGAGISFFSHMFRENWGEFCDLATAEGSSVSQHGVVGHMDPGSGAMTAQDYQLLRQKLGR